MAKPLASIISQGTSLLQGQRVYHWMQMMMRWRLINDSSSVLEIVREVDTLYETTYVYYFILHSFHFQSTFSFLVSSSYSFFATAFSQHCGVTAMEVVVSLSSSSSASFFLLSIPNQMRARMMDPATGQMSARMQALSS